jgi:hypothetical protein
MTVCSLFELAKRALYRKYSQQLLYEKVDNAVWRQRFSEVEEIKQFVYDLQRIETQKTHAARIIQKAYKAFMKTCEKFHIKVIKTCSLAHPGVTLFHNKRCYILLNCANFNYFSFLNPVHIQHVEKEGEIVKIHINRYSIRHCYDRHIAINLKSGYITWFESDSNTGNILSQNVISNHSMWFVKLR